MDLDVPSTSRPKKVRFTPKPPPRQRNPQLAVPKKEVDDGGDPDGDAEAEAGSLLRRFNERLRRGPRGAPNTEKKSSLHVAFGLGASSATSAKAAAVQPSEGTSSGGEIVSQSSKMKIKKPYRAPWDCHVNNYPTTLPWRMASSIDPEELNEEEFGKAATAVEHDENAINSASELGLLEESNEANFFFLQLPPNLPLVKRSASAKGKEIVGSSISADGVNPSKKGCLAELGGGYMGKMLVFKSGAVKLKLGEILYDVWPGSDCTFAQDVIAMNTEKGHCCVIGELGKKIVVTPDDSLLNSVLNLS